MKTYVVVIKDGYTRDTQILETPRELTSDEYDTLNNTDGVVIDGFEVEWKDYSDIEVYLSCVKAENPEIAISIVADRYDLKEYILRAYEV